MERDGSFTPQSDLETLASSCDTQPMSIAEDAARALEQAGVCASQYASGSLFARSAIDGSRIGKLQSADFAGTDKTLQRGQEAALAWSEVPPVRRAEFVRQAGDQLRKARAPLARLVMLETGRTYAESLLEVDFAISCCDHAFGSAQKIGLTGIRADRKGFWVTERWRALGVTGCISPFNRPLSQFAAFSFLSLVCGNSVVWKPSERASLCALAMHTVLSRTARENDDVPEGLLAILFGGRDVGKILAEDFRLRYLDAATSIAAGRMLATKMGQNFTRGSLSLGGNNATIICSSADLTGSANAVVASAILGAGQHNMCTRRLFVHADIHRCFMKKVKLAFSRLPVGDPRRPGILMGPLIDSGAYEKMQRTLVAARNAGGEVSGGARLEIRDCPGGYYVRPAVVEVPTQNELMLRETVTPILFVMPFTQLDHALRMDEASEAGMASSIFTHNMSEVDQFARVNDCGMLNVNTLHAGYDVDIALARGRSSGGGRPGNHPSWKGLMQRSVISMNMSRPDPVPDVVGMVERGEL